MNRPLYIGFKGKNNSSCILVKLISDDSYLLTNSFEGLKKDIEVLNQTCDYVVLFGIDSKLKNVVRIERIAEKETKEISVMDLEDISKQLNTAGVSNYLSDNPTHYLCNDAYWYLLRRFNGKVVLIHIPSIKNINENLIEGLKQVFKIIHFKFF